jgi:hypothetical protein
MQAPRRTVKRIKSFRAGTASDGEKIKSLRGVRTMCRWPLRQYAGARGRVRAGRWANAPERADAWGLAAGPMR